MHLCTVSAESVASWTASEFFLCIYDTNQPGLHKLTSWRSRPTPTSSHLPWACRKCLRRPLTSLIEDTQVQNRLFTTSMSTHKHPDWFCMFRIFGTWNQQCYAHFRFPCLHSCNRSGLLRAGYCSSLQPRKLTQTTLQRWLLPCWLRRSGLRWMRTTRRPTSSTWELCLRKNPNGLKTSGGWVKT